MGISTHRNRVVGFHSTLSSSSPPQLTATARLASLGMVPSRWPQRVVPCRAMGQEKGATIQVALHACLLALHALRTEPADTQRREGKEPTPAATSGTRTAGEKQLKEGKNAGFVKV